MSSPAQPRKELLEFRVDALERDRDEDRARFERFERAVESIDNSLKKLTKLEIHNSETQEAIKRAFQSIADHEMRLRPIEADLPTMRLVRGWVIGGVIGVCSLLGVAVVSLVVVNNKQPATQVQAQAFDRK